MSRTCRAKGTGCVILAGIGCFFMTSCENGQESRGGPGAVFNAGAAAVGGRIFLIGGLGEGFQVRAAVYEYDVSSRRWQTRSQMAKPRVCLAVAVLDGRAYVVGGRRGDEVLGSVECYDPSADSWTKRAPMPTPRWKASAVGVEGRIYVIGGIAGTGSMRKALGVVEVYDPAKDSWETLAALPQPRSGAAAAAVGQRIYIIGGRAKPGVGRSATNSVFVYDIPSGKWSEVARTGDSRTDARACVVDTKIYVVGGALGGSATASIETYDPVTDTWGEVRRMSGPRTGHCCVPLGGTIYVIGGMRKPEQWVTAVEALRVGG